jgi:hypothetical protein
VVEIERPVVRGPKKNSSNPRPPGPERQKTRKSPAPRSRNRPNSKSQSPEDHQPLEPVLSRADKPLTRRRPTARARDGILDADAPKDACVSNPGSSMPTPRRTPASRILDPLPPPAQRLLAEGTLKDLCDTSSFKELKKPAPFARSVLPRRTNRSFGVSRLGHPRAHGKPCASG